MALQPGERFGRYELVSRLGRGGMAETYRARLVGEAGVTKPVLIKKVLPEYANDQAFSTMLISEARISATLSHGNIAQVYDFGRVDGEYFLAMEYVDGQPLHRIIKRALRSELPSIPVSLAVFIGIEMCRGLHYAHTRTNEAGEPLGIVHRDISPDNVLVSYEGQVKIVDFGIAKARELRGFNTEPGVVKGKYLFFSPEQAQGHEVDARTDVWATGIVLYEMLCGRLPVEGPSYTVVPKLVRGEFPSPREINPQLPQALEDIVMQALTVDRKQRLEFCQELGDALAGFLHTIEPRFSGMSLAYFVRHLFREELISEGRQVQVPRWFLEQMAQWQRTTVPATPAYSPLASSEPPPSENSSGAAEDELKVSAYEEPAPTAMSKSKKRFLWMGGGAVLTVMALVLLFVFRGEVRSQDLQESSSKPLNGMEVRGTAPPRENGAALTGSVSPRTEKAPQELKVQDLPPHTLQEAPPEAPEPSPADLEAAKNARDSAWNQVKAKQYVEIRPLAERCIELDPSDGECHLLMGIFYAGAQEWGRAIPHYERFLQLAPDHKYAPKIRESVKQIRAQEKGGRW
jgi:serine/threonine protein kinase